MSECFLMHSESLDVIVIYQKYRTYASSTVNCTVWVDISTLPNSTTYALLLFFISRFVVDETTDMALLNPP
jgi:hypothetical protein